MVTTRAFIIGLPALKSNVGGSLCARPIINNVIHTSIFPSCIYIYTHMFIYVDSILGENAALQREYPDPEP